MLHTNLTAPVFSFSWLRNESHQTPIEIKLVVMFYDRPGGFATLEKLWFQDVSNGLFHNSRGYRYFYTSPKVAHNLGDSVLQ